nr:MAG TPA: HNH endonuclease bacteriophage, HNH Endonuclease, DNA.52A [Caudoviricetes sp.]
MNIRTYEKLIRIPDYDGRIKYLQTNNVIGEDTFGGSRILNQTFYKSDEWKALRRDAIIRDKDNDLGIPGMKIVGKVYVHHIEPITKEDLLFRSDKVLSLDNVICCSDITHKRIHYGDSKGGIRKLSGDRRTGDTKLW